MYIQKINTGLSCFQLFSIFKEKPYSFILDSGMDHEKLGRYSFIGFDPAVVFKSKNNKIQVVENGKRTSYSGNPLDILRKIYSRYSLDYKSDIPFVGGFVGYLGYDLCHHIEKLPRTAVDDIEIPDSFLGLYDGIVVIDHKEDTTYVVALGIREEAKSLVDRIARHIDEEEKKGVSINIDFASDKSVEMKSNFTKEAYIKSVNKIKNYIKAGDIYQANLTQRFQCTMKDSPYELYGKLRRINPAPFASFINFGEGHIVSSSPERFIRIKDGIMETRPIKGTRPRGKTIEEDNSNKNQLLNSEKDKAELLMIVDLERNDLGRVAETGTVKVTELFHLEKYPTVYHLVATIEGELRKDCDVIDAIKATFPGGSITGAPKIRAMEIIDELEPTQRNVYTGSIGYIGLNGDMDLNIVIRTILCKNNQAYFQVGGGIVWDSDAEEEYEETLHKARALIQALNS
ncbi:aminodeoxychorismate synthase, subunit I [Natronincola peptidivorans]|uniref:aminodeoxychorismate synthase n=1 Tax=Natronincola peptidivorans TaxID=426128 RepID=A0A1I0DP96_9FIRM|nr:aminodeoxychorismate synthase component I [Natronincola peptidivorans]SET33708.1 aminodeoxychorismate synthase, subunit I [Natronincola peptidivorans]